MKKLAMIVVVFMLMISGCMKNIYFDGKSATYEHARGSFKKAMLDAQEKCASEGKLVKHESTDCPHNCVSTFSCVDK